MTCRATCTGFTFTATVPGTGAVIGCVYIYPARDDAHDADVRSWVDAEHAELDGPLHDAVGASLADRWPFSRVAPQLTGQRSDRATASRWS